MTQKICSRASEDTVRRLQSHGQPPLRLPPLQLSTETIGTWKVIPAGALTYEEGILNAFTAILEDHTAQHGTKFCWGLPIQNFEEALMWVNGRYYSGTMPSLKRRLGHSEGNHQFPSWSWAGWIGRVSF
jgi:hypothetical protein